MVMPRQPREARSKHGPDEVEAGRFAGQSADDLDAAAGLAEGAFDEVGVPDAAVVLDREPQVAGQLRPVGEQTLHRGRVGASVLLGEGVDAPLHGGDQIRSGRHPGGDQRVGVEDRPVGVAHLALRLGGQLGNVVAAAVRL
jgi:hypothetical protein